MRRRAFRCTGTWHPPQMGAIQMTRMTSGDEKAKDEQILSLLEKPYLTWEIAMRTRMEIIDRNL